MKITLTPTMFIAIIALVNIALYNIPLFSYAVDNMQTLSIGSLHILIGMTVVLFVFTTFFLYLLMMLSRRLAKLFCMVMVLGNSIALYFTVNYQVILDRTMMGNIFNTRYTEASDFFGWRLLLYIIILGLLPAWLIVKTTITPTKRLKLSMHMLIILVFSSIFIYLSSSTWLWFDKNAKQLGARIMPWSYTINAIRYQVSEYEATRNRVLLPPATFVTNDPTQKNLAINNGSINKNVVILVIGESARAQNFSLYGYERDTNPLLKKSDIITLKNTVSCSTYTTASVGCMLSHKSDNSMFSAQYEPLPSYLKRHGVEVIWRTHNWGEPPIKVDSYEKAEDLRNKCTADDCAYDGVLLTELKDRIASSHSQNILVVLHQSGSHGPSYSKKYPKSFEKFKPVCDTVELRQCDNQSLINAYDNTILYTDYFLNNTVNILKGLENTSSVLMYMSDHGESLGEHNVYLHGTPYSVAPKEQKDVPFLVWMSPLFMKEHHVSPQDISQDSAYSQANIFHSVMGAFNLTSAIYDKQLDIYSNKHQKGNK